MGDAQQVAATGARGKLRFARWAALVSLSSPFAAFLFWAVLFAVAFYNGTTRLSTLTFLAVVPIGLILLGIGIGIAAMVIPRREERAGIFWRGVAGTCLNALVLTALMVGPILAAHSLGNGSPTTPGGRLAAATNKLETAGSEAERFYALDDAAKESFIQGRMEDASNYATQLLTLAPKYRGDWNYGNAIQDGNIVLGRMAVKDGRTNEAKQFLLAAGASPGSPQMNSFGPNVSLANDLLKLGDRDTPLQYFGMCRKFWRMNYGKLDDWSNAVQSGRTPDFGASLIY